MNERENFDVRRLHIEDISTFDEDIFVFHTRTSPLTWEELQSLPKELYKRAQEMYSQDENKKLIWEALGNKEVYPLPEKETSFLDDLD